MVKGNWLWVFLFPSFGYRVCWRGFHTSQRDSVEILSLHGQPLSKLCLSSPSPHPWERQMNALETFFAEESSAAIYRAQESDKDVAWALAQPSVCTNCHRLGENIVIFKLIFSKPIYGTCMLIKLFLACLQNHGTEISYDPIKHPQLCCIFFLTRPRKAKQGNEV